MVEYLIKYILPILIENWIIVCAIIIPMFGIILIVCDIIFGTYNTSTMHKYENINYYSIDRDFEIEK